MPIRTAQLRSRVGIQVPGPMAVVLAGAVSCFMVGGTEMKTQE